MRIISFSDLHLEFGTDVRAPDDSLADVMILCGDICVAGDFEPLSRFIDAWRKPILYVLGNHEYYGRLPMPTVDAMLIEYLAEHHPNATVLRDEAIAIDGVNFFGGTMWTDFDKANDAAMDRARAMMNDYRRISVAPGVPLTPLYTTALHSGFVDKLEAWLSTALAGSRVVISHHAPTLNPVSQYKGSELQPAFNSLDVETLILKYKPDAWLYGHTHECDDHVFGQTRIISNQAGYPQKMGQLECKSFDRKGLPFEVV